MQPNPPHLPAAGPPATPAGRRRTARPPTPPADGVRLTCRRAELLAACQRAGQVVPAGQQQPVLRNVKLVAAAGRCTIEATNQEYGVRLVVGGVTAAADGQVLLPADHLTTILREAADGEVTVESAGPLAVVRAGLSEFELNTADPSTFPDVPSPRRGVYHEARAEELRAAVHRTTFAVGRENAPHGLTGVLWEATATELRLVATDAKRLVVNRCPAAVRGGSGSGDRRAVVPSKAMLMLGRVLDDADDPDEPVQVFIGENEAHFRAGDAVLHTRLLDARFPAYHGVLSRQVAVSIPLPVGPFHSVIRQAAILTTGEAQGVELAVADGTLTLTTRTPQVGRSLVQMAVAYTGEPMAVRLDPVLVRDGLRTLPDDQTLMMELSGPAGPVGFRLGTAFTYLLMPMC